MVFESVVVDVLNRFLGDYVVNLDSSQLKLGIWGGNRTCVCLSSEHLAKLTCYMLIIVSSQSWVLQISPSCQCHFLFLWLSFASILWPLYVLDERKCDFIYFMQKLSHFIVFNCGYLTLIFVAWENGSVQCSALP